MKRTKVLAIAGSIALLAGAMVSIPSAAQAASVSQCGATTRESTWFMEGYVGQIQPCYEVEVRISVYNNYGLAGTYTKTSTSYADITVSPSYAPGTYTTHAYRDLIKGKSWSAWLSV
jgi:hypothetical protein